MVRLDGMLELGTPIQPDDETRIRGGTVLESESARSRRQKILSIPEAMLIAISIPPLRQPSPAPTLEEIRDGVIGEKPYSGTYLAV